MPISETQPQQSEVTAQQAGAFRRMLGRAGLGISPMSEQQLHQTINPFESDNFALLAPTLNELSEQAATRTSLFTYLEQNNHISSDSFGMEEASQGSEVTLSEGEGIAGFLDFLDELYGDLDSIDFPQEGVKALVTATGKEKVIWGEDVMDKPKPEEDVKTWIRKRIDALRATSFLGSAEFTEATSGIANYWRSYLEGDPNTQIYLPEIQGGKSSSFVIENILSNFTDVELEALRGRIVGSIETVTSSPDNLKVILVDDSMMSGDQMRERIKRVWRPQVRMSFEEEINLEKEYREKYADCLEIDLLMGDEQRIDEGSQDANIEDAGTIPVKAYFKAPVALDAKDKNQRDDYIYPSRITGIYSSVDVHFSLTVSNVISIMNRFRSEDMDAPNYKMPPLTNIVRTYRNVRHERTIDLFAAA
jgi:hypothetical protein